MYADPIVHGWMVTLIALNIMVCLAWPFFALLLIWCAVMDARTAISDYRGGGG